MTLLEYIQSYKVVTVVAFHVMEDLSIVLGGGLRSPRALIVTDDINSNNMSEK